MNFSFSLSGITRTGSMGLISARFIQAPLMISVAKLSEKKLKTTFLAAIISALPNCIFKIAAIMMIIKVDGYIFRL